MTKFTVHAEERVFYTFYIEAESMEAAEKLISIGEYDTGDPIDGDDFQITNIFPSKESVAS